jgi:Tol biopolymer transport system component
MNRNRKTKQILICGLVVASVVLITGRDANADFVFGTPRSLGATVNTSFHEAATGISPDGLSLFLDSNRSGWFDIWVTTRAKTDDDWGSPEKLVAPISTNSWDGVPSLSADGLSLFFTSDRAGGYGGLGDIWVSTRETTDDEWGEPENLGSTVNSASWEWTQCISADGLSLYFASDRLGGSGDLDLWVTTRATVSEAWGEPVNLGPTVNSSAWELSPTITPDGLVLFLTSTRAGGRGDRDVWMTRRPTISDPWQEPVNLGPPINTSAMDTCSVISPDGSTLYFSTMRSGGFGGLDIWQVSISPVVDFNNDGNVDLKDVGMLLMLGWGTDNSRYDIGPMPWGDGIVDCKDLMVLVEHGAMLAGDVNYDGVVDSKDAMVVAEHGAMLAGDVNYDGVVDFFDLAEVAKNWLRQQP